MKLIILAFIISISLHLLLFNNYELIERPEASKKALKKEEKANITFVTIKKEKKLEKKILVKKNKPVKEKVIKKTVKKSVKKLVKAPKKNKLYEKKSYKDTNTKKDENSRK